MKESFLPTFRELHKAFSKTSSKLNPSQVHGLICGFICGNPKKPADWEELVSGGKESPDTHKVLQELYDSNAKLLNEFMFEFQLILPADSSSLPQRAEALTLWCQGVLTGLKLAQVQIIGRDPGEITEAMNDIIEIAKMNYDDVVASDEDETAYVELVEYVRLAVILIYQCLREHETENKSTSSSTHLH